MYTIHYCIHIKLIKDKLGETEVPYVVMQDAAIGDAIAECNHQCCYHDTWH